MIKKFKYYLFYKPFQVLCQFSPEPGKLTLSDFITVEKDVYPVGRLDFDSEGLLLLTNDNRLKTKLLSPENEHYKSYLVQVEGDIDSFDLSKLENGVEINLKGKIYRTKKCNAKKLELVPDLPERVPPIRFRRNIPVSWLEISISEGKNRQVRKMTAAVGFPTLRLIRIKFDIFSLGELKPGELREISFQ